VPGYFAPAYRNPDTSNTRPLLLRYERLAPFRSLLIKPGARFLANGWATDLCSYIAVTSCTAMEYHTFMATKPAAASVADWLAREQGTVFCAAEGVVAAPATRSSRASARGDGWDPVASVQTADGSWRLLSRRDGAGG